jgi:hypothetical protein
VVVVGGPVLRAGTPAPRGRAGRRARPPPPRGLFGGNRGKMGLQPTSPKAGQPLAQTRAWYNATLTIGRLVTALSFLFIFFFSMGLLIAMLTGEMPLTTLDVALISAITFFAGAFISVYAAIPLLVAWGVIGLFKMSSVANWNRFWSQRPAPPELLLGSRGEGQVGAWLG